MAIFSKQTKCHLSPFSTDPFNYCVPYITLGETEGVITQSVPPLDDGVSLPIDVNFPFGSQIQSTVYVC